MTAAANRTGYIQSHRWGDAPLQTYAVRLFMESNATHQILNMEYIHGSHRNRIRNGSLDHLKGVISVILYGNYTCEPF